MLDFFKTLVAAGLPGLAYSDLLSMLVNPVIGPKGHIYFYLLSTGTSTGTSLVAAVKLPYV
jgi:hypothetical protein